MINGNRPLQSFPAVRLGLAALTAFTLSQCASGPTPKSHTDIVVSVKEQKMALYNRSGVSSRQYPISTSKFGLSDKPGTYGTPLGMHEVVAKIGHGAPAGAVFKSRRWTGEIIKPDSPGRDPIVSRIMWLRGMESTNKNAYARCIYIHGTAEEKNIGKPVSYGCIRMKSRDVIDLFNRLPIGSRVLVTREALPTSVPTLPVEVPTTPTPATQPPIFLNPQQHEQNQRGSKPVEVPVLAQNKASRSKPAAPAPAPRPAPEPRPIATALRTPPPQPAATRPQPLPGGGAVLYSAPTGGTPGVILRSRRASDSSAAN